MNASQPADEMASPREQIEALGQEPDRLLEQAYSVTELQGLLREQAAKLDLLHAELRALQREVKVKDEFIDTLRKGRDIGTAADGYSEAGRFIVMKAVLRHAPPLYRAASAIRRKLRTFLQD